MGPDQEVLELVDYLIEKYPQLKEADRIQFAYDLQAKVEEIAARPE